MTVHIIRSCQTCRFFSKVENNTVCMFNPPVPLAIQTRGNRPGEMGFVINPMWPPVGPKNWCGQWSGVESVHDVSAEIPMTGTEN